MELAHLTFIDKLPINFRQKLKAMQWVKFREINEELRQIKL